MRPRRILAIGTSGNRTSINQTLAVAAARMIDKAEVETLSVRDFELPLFNDEREAELGAPLLAREFLARIRAADAIVISFAEYNGSYTASFKNIFDWASRLEKQVFLGKPAVFLSASPGPGGASSVMSQALASARFWGAEVVASLSIPNFAENFDYLSDELKSNELRRKLTAAMQELQAEIGARRVSEQDSGQKSVASPETREVHCDAIG